MANTNRAAESDPRPVPVDLAAVTVLSAVSVFLALVPSLNVPVVRSVVGGLAVFVAPGYALLAALFPAGERGWSATTATQFDAIERLVVGSALSLAVTGLLVIALGLLAVPLVPVVVVGGLGVCTIAASIAATIRRRRLPQSVRYRVDGRAAVAGVRARLGAIRARPLDRSNLLALVVVCSLAVAATGVGFAATQRTTGESFTELSILTERPNGELVADDYPTTYVAGESETLVVAVGNHEGQALSYTVVVTLGPDDAQTLDTFSTGTIQPSETETFERRLTPERTGDRQKLSFLLYRGDPPSDPGPDTAYRETHLWISVAADR